MPASACAVPKALQDATIKLPRSKLSTQEIVVPSYTYHLATTPNLITSIHHALQSAAQGAHQAPHP
jgi:hypothetical protein